MHSHLLDGSDVDSNLYPALLQVFTIILLGYLAGALKIISKEQGSGLNVFVGTFILPALLLKNIATLDFSIVDWYFLGSIFVSKSLVFFLAMVLTLCALRPTNIGMAAVFAIFVSQSNDFALGVPIVDAIYSDSHPNFINYIYLIAPISLCVLNPIAFFFLELNEHWSKLKEQEHVKDVEGSNIEEQSDNESSVQEAHTSADSTTNSFDRSLSYEFVTAPKSKMNSIEPKKMSRRKLLKHTLWSTIKNPIVFMTFVGLIVNLIFDQKIPALIEPIITTLANSFSALALFYLGMTMVGKIRNLNFTMIIIMIILIFSKGLLFPLITREMVSLFESFKSSNVTEVEESDLSTFGFLYGTFPSAPSLLVFIGRYKAVQHDLVSSAIIFGTFASAPLMMASGKMISIEYFNQSSTNFDDIQCKTAYGFSFVTWFCCAWVMYIFIASGRIRSNPHRYTFYLIIAQMLNSLVHITWVTFTNDSFEVNIYASYTYVFFSLFAAFLTRCIPLAISLNLISISKLQQYNHFPLHRGIFWVADSKAFLAFVSLILPFSCAIICIIAGDIPEKQGMMISVGKPQIIISILLLVYIIFSIAYGLILFARTKFDQSSGLAIVSNKRTRYYSTQSPPASDLSGNNSEAETSLLGARYRSATLDQEISSLVKMNIQYQIMQHISLIIILLFVTVMCLFVQIWNLKIPTNSGIFYELQLLDTTLLYGQGFFVFMTFGLDNQIIFAPIIFKIKTWLKLIKPFNILPFDELSEETVDKCKKFENKYRESCARAIEKDQRFHYTLHHNVFSGSDLIDWLISKRLVKTRKQGKHLGRDLIQGRLIHHVSFKRDFHDGYNLYKFD